MWYFICPPFKKKKNLILSDLFLKCRPDIEEGEKLIRRRKNPSKCADQSLFLNFAMHSVRMEACDCPPTHHVPSPEQSNSSVLPGANTQFVGQHENGAGDEESNHCPEYTEVKRDDFFWDSKKGKKNKGRNPVNKASQVGEKSRCAIQESEKHRRVGNDGFLRVLFWQFHNFRMLLGSDLLLFSNEKYVAVSLHLWDVSRQVEVAYYKSCPFLSFIYFLFAYPLFCFFFFAFLFL